MEAVVFEAEGTGGHAWTFSHSIKEPASPPSPRSFAPSRLFQQHSRIRKKPPQPLQLDTIAKKGAVAQIHETCSSAIHSRLGWTENAHFLEQFRYIIVASQLLSEHLNPITYKRQPVPKPAGGSDRHRESDRLFVPSLAGLTLTAATAFLLPWSIRWLHKKLLTSYGFFGVFLLVSGFAVALTIIYTFARRQWLHNLRMQAIESASILTTYMQQCDAAISAGITLIQEVELVSRGYHM
ncbi:MAG: hypothetical protein Q9164_000462 [Protoblastenia rupestris]